MFTPYGYDNFYSLIAISVLLITLGYFLPFVAISGILYALGIGILALTLWFFRDPQRTIPTEALNNDAIIIAPADGKVMEIIEIDEKRLIKGKAKQISIFLSPLDVHVNRIPANGRVVFSDYFPGLYLMAFNPKSSELNEHTLVGMENSAGKFLFKQITGFLARRIVCDLNVNANVKAGDKFGMMKFGSRMDIIIPPDTEILISEGNRVVGGETIIAKLR